MKTYTTSYENKDGRIEDCQFKANNLKEAKAYAQRFKRHNPHLKGCLTSTRLNKITK